VSQEVLDRYYDKGAKIGEERAKKRVLEQAVAPTAYFSSFSQQALYISSTHSSS